MDDSRYVTVERNVLDARVEPKEMRRALALLSSAPSRDWQSSQKPRRTGQKEKMEQQTRYSPISLLRRGGTQSRCSLGSSM